VFVWVGWVGVFDVIIVDFGVELVWLIKGDGNGWVECVCGWWYWGCYGVVGLLVICLGI